MKAKAKKPNDDVKKLIQSGLQHEDVYVRIEKDTTLERVQLTEYDDPRFYNPDSDSRFGDSKGKIGVCYVAGSGEVAIAESFQQKLNGDPVLLKDLEVRSLFTLKTARPLKVVDVARLNAYVGNKLRDIVQAKGQGSEGYDLPQTLSSICMRHSDEIDGLVYTSTVLPGVSFGGCNLALFGGREAQLVPIDSTPVLEVELPSGETALGLLVSLKVSVV